MLKLSHSFKAVKAFVVLEMHLKKPYAAYNRLVRVVFMSHL